jgi:hypothetical protein
LGSQILAAQVFDGTRLAVARIIEKRIQATTGSLQGRIDGLSNGSIIVKFKRSYLQTFSGKIFKILGLARCGKGSVTTGLKPRGGAQSSIR